MLRTTPCLIVANWKLHGDRASVRAWLHAVEQAQWNLPEQVKAVFCPPMPYLAVAAAARAPNTRLVLGAQSCSDQVQGAFTGEVGAAQIRDSGAEYVIVGHSERRKRGETDEMRIGQLTAAARAGLTPIFCIGETADERMSGKTDAALTAQMQVLHEYHAELVVAYEPVWAIGSGLTPAVEEIAAAHRTIRAVRQKSGRDSAFSVLYGGSVKPANIQEILAIPAVDGVLVGSASLDAAAFVAMLDAAGGRA
jgi:triosephosphate isomerase